MPTLRNLTTGADLARFVVRANSPLARTVGWLRAARIAPQQGLWLRPCSAIHTFGMRTAIDVILLDRDSSVVALRPRVKPNHPCVAHWRAKSVIEMGPGFLDGATLAIGDRLALLEPAAS